MSFGQRFDETIDVAPQMQSINIMDEHNEVDSLFRETQDGVFRQRNNSIASCQGGDDDDSLRPSLMGLVRARVGNAVVVRVLACVMALVILSVAVIQVWSQTLEQSLDAQPEHKTHHGPSYGGRQNPLHFNLPSSIGSKFDDDTLYDTNFDDDAFIDLVLPKSNVGAAVESVSSANQANLAGHYLHDPFRSPYASPLYRESFNNQSRAQELQNDFLHLKTVATARFGRWETPIVDNVIVPHHEDESLSKVPYMDWTSFPEKSWQTDPKYLGEFLVQAKDLVHRVKEGIYTEYGWGILKEHSVKERDEKIARREREFGVIREKFRSENGTAFESGSNKRMDGIAYMNEPAWEALVRKILHAMMTSGDFFVVSAGPASSYLGNNFFQSSAMQFNYIMEPVLDKLGVRLISRNMGMDSSVLNSAFGGADIYGEADIFLYQGEPESANIMDFLHRQTVLSGERVPILLTPSADLISASTEGKVWAGNLQPGASFCSESRLEDGKFIVPKIKSCKYVSCPSDSASRCDKHNSVCWVDRVDVSQEMAQQNQGVGWEHQGLPNYNTQKLEGRKLAMLMLHALDEALGRWADQTVAGILPLPSEIWHVGEFYQEVRETVRTSDSTECGQLLRRLDRSLCHVELHAFTEWTPRVHPHVKRLKEIIQNKHIADNTESMGEVYKTVDLLPLEWKIPDHEIDVHMIAIASDTNYLFEGDESDKIVLSDDEINPIFNEYLPLDGPDGDYGFNGYIGDVDDVDGLDHHHNRELVASEFSRINSWTIFDAPVGFCDGSAQSRCNRSAQNPCLLANYNFHRAGIMGHGESGKLQLKIPNVREGIIVARFDWKLENGPRVKNLPGDAAIIFTVDGVETRHDRRSFAHHAIDLTDDVRFHVIMNDKEMAQTEGVSKDVDVEIEVISQIEGSTTPLLLLSHIYFA